MKLRHKYIPTSSRCRCVAAVADVGGDHQFSRAGVGLHIPAGSEGRLVCQSVLVQNESVVSGSLLQKTSYAPLHYEA